MSINRSSDAHVVVASVPGEAGSIVTSKLFAVAAASAKEAEQAVHEVVPEGVVVAAATGSLATTTIAGLDLHPGEVKQIG